MQTCVPVEKRSKREQRAAKAGSAWAMEKVATFYEEGYGCTANRALADACRETLKYMR